MSAKRPGKMSQGRKAAFRFFCWVNPILSGVNGLFRLSLKDRDEENALYACQSVLDICRRNGWHYVFVLKEGRSPSIFKEAQSILDLSDGQWGKVVHDVRKRKECVANDARRAFENLSVGCRKVAQGMWGRKICEALHYYDYSAVERETVYLNNEYEDICRSTSRLVTGRRTPDQRPSIRNPKHLSDWGRFVSSGLCAKKTSKRMG